jgi:hypothetical protein
MWALTSANDGPLIGTIALAPKQSRAIELVVKRVDVTRLLSSFKCHLSFTLPWLFVTWLKKTWTHLFFDGSSSKFSFIRLQLFVFPKSTRTSIMSYNDDYDNNNRRGGGDSRVYGGGGGRGDNYYDQNQNYGDNNRNGYGGGSGGYDNDRSQYQGRRNNDDDYSGGGARGYGGQQERHGGRRNDENESYGGRQSGGGGYGGGNDDYDQDEVVQQAERHGGGSGNSGLFSQAMSFLNNNKQSVQNEDIDEDRLQQSHRKLYQQDGGNQQQDANSLGAGAAMQACVLTWGCSMTTQSLTMRQIEDVPRRWRWRQSVKDDRDGNVWGFEAVRSAEQQGKYHSFCILSQADSVIQGNLAGGTDKQSVVNSAAAMAFKMFMKSQGGGGGGASGLMSLASKYFNM